MSLSREYRLARLSAKLKTVELARRPEDDSTATKVGKTAAKVGGAAAALGGAAYLRGRMGGVGSGLFGTMKAGAGLFRNDARAGLQAARSGGDWLANQINRIRGGRPRLTA